MNRIRNMGGICPERKVPAGKKRASLLPAVIALLLSVMLFTSACGSSSGNAVSSADGSTAGNAVSSTPGNAAGNTADGAALGDTDNTSENTPDNTAGGVPGSTAENTVSSTPGNMPDDAADNSAEEPGKTEGTENREVSEDPEAAAETESAAGGAESPEATEAVTAEEETAGPEDPEKDEEGPDAEEAAGAVADTDNGGKEAQIGDCLELEWDENWTYADYSKIHSDSVKLYISGADERRDRVIAVNAGHGTSGGSKVKTLCHPDGTPKVTGGSTAAGELKAVAVSSGTTMKDGTSEGKVNLKLALIVKDVLLENGYDVLMIRENNDTQLDNIARTVFANRYADCHIALHYDSSENDKGLFCIGVPDVKSYRSMEPVASHYKEHMALCEALVEGEKEVGVKIYGSGIVNIDLTQTSYSTVPSVDMEVGDQVSDYSPETHKKIAEGILKGLEIFFADGE